MMKFKYIILLTVVLMLITGCAGKEDKSIQEGYPVNVCGTEFNKAPQRVIVLSDSLADVILATSYEIVLYGKSSECTQSELKSLTDIGPSANPDIEKIKSLSPDLIICATEPYEGFTAKMGELNIKVLAMPYAKTRKELENLYGNIGCIFGGGKKGLDKATEVAKKIILSVDDVTRHIPQSSSYITACYMFDNNGKVATGDMFAGKLFECAGAVNVAEGNVEGIKSKEEMVLANPNFIFCPPSQKESIVQTPEFASMDAVLAERVVGLEESTMTRQGKTILTAVKIIAKTIYPQAELN